MITLPEYAAVSGQIMALGKQADELVASSIDSLTTAQAIDFTKNVAKSYQSDLEDIVNDGLMEAADAVFDEYEHKTGQALSRKAIKTLVATSAAEKFYGATLNQRYKTNYKRLQHNIERSAAVKKEHLSKVFTEPYPFGAQTNIDKRVLQAQMIKLEQDIALYHAKELDLPLIRWTLAGKHGQPDICDDLAAAVSHSVVEFLSENELDINPKGLYFREDLPRPPHPNCQCEYALVSFKGKEPERRSGVRRSIAKLRSLIKRISSK